MMEIQIWYILLFIAEAVIALLYFDYLFARTSRAWIRLITFACGYALLYVVSLWDNTAINSVSFCIVNFCLIVINYQCKIKTAIFHTAFLCFIMLMAETLILLILNAFGYDFADYQDTYYVLVILIVLSKLLYHFLSVVGARVFAPHKATKEEPRFMIIFCALPFLSVVLALIMITIGMHTEMAGASWFMMLLTTVSLFAVNLVVMLLYNQLLQSQEEQILLQLSLQKEQADTAHYKALQEQSELQHILIHDIKNHLHTIENLASVGKMDDLRKYISYLEKDFFENNDVRLCADPILNMLLLEFSQDCRKKDITFTCDVRDNCIDFMNAASITSFFGNLLSNAQEAAAASKERQIELSVIANRAQETVHISVINSCDEKPVMDSSGNFISKKNDRGYHGIGLKSIKRTVRQYNGISTMFYKADEQRFYHIFQFPINQVADTYQSARFFL